MKKLIAFEKNCRVVHSLKSTYFYNYYLRYLFAYLARSYFSTL